MKYDYFLFEHNDTKLPLVRVHSDSVNFSNGNELHQHLIKEIGTDAILLLRDQNGMHNAFPKMPDLLMDQDFDNLKWMEREFE